MRFYCWGLLAEVGGKWQTVATVPAEVKLRAERKAGELLQQLERQPGARTDVQPPDKLSGGSEYRQTLQETRVEERTARRWQTVATVPDEVFEEHVATVQQEQRAFYLRFQPGI